MPLIHYILGVAVLTTCTSCYLTYTKLFGPKNYKILKEYVYKSFPIQTISNPHDNICGNCCDLIEKDDEIYRYPHCDHHFCSSCIHELIDESIRNLKNPIDKHPCTLCFDNKL